MGFLEIVFLNPNLTAIILAYKESESIKSYEHVIIIRTMHITTSFCTTDECIMEMID
jgi:hypothetical protein